MNDPIIHFVFILAGLLLAGFLPNRRSPSVMMWLGCLYLTLISPASLVVLVAAVIMASVLALSLSKLDRKSRLKKYLPYVVLVNLFFVDFSTILVGFPVATIGLSFSVIRIFMTLKEFLGSRANTKPKDVYWICVAAFYLPALIIGPVFSGLSLKKQIIGKSMVTDGTSKIWRLIVWGLALSVLFAAGLQNYALELSDGSIAQEWILYPIVVFIQLFFAFWGQSLVAENTSKLIGLQLPQNFIKPWLATSPRDFWARWHRSMADFVMKFIFLPLNINSFNAKISMLASFVFMGLWHNISFGYLIWGAGHGLMLGFYPERAMAKSKTRRFFGRVITLSVVVGLSYVANHVVFF